jgi:hypothetical protein
MVEKHGRQSNLVFFYKNTKLSQSAFVQQNGAVIRDFIVYDLLTWRRERLIRFSLTDDPVSSKHSPIHLNISSPHSDPLINSILFLQLLWLILLQLPIHVQMIAAPHQPSQPSTLPPSNLLQKIPLRPQTIKNFPICNS